MWDWGGLVGKDGRAIFLSANGEYTRAGGRSSGLEAGCQLNGMLDRPVQAGGEVEGLFFVVPRSEGDGERCVAWSEFTELP